MQENELPTRRTLEIPFSEVAMHTRVAGRTLDVIEEDHYVNGKEIPADQRRGCFVLDGNARIPMLKSEAGWDDDEAPFDQDTADLAKGLGPIDRGAYDQENEA